MVLLNMDRLCLELGILEKIIEFSDGLCYLSIISLKNFYLFKITELVINLCLKNFLTNNFKHVEVF